MADQYTKQLENVVKQALKPLKGVPFNLIIESMTGRRVLDFDPRNSEHKLVLNLMEKAVLLTGKNINRTGIARPRPNEVGNDIEPYIKKALNQVGLRSDTPSGPKGNKKAAGYPDIVFWHQKHPFYLECKTYNLRNLNTTQRSFYLSPSDEFKVIYDAPHFLVSFEIVVAGEKGENHIYKCKNYKILSIKNLSIDAKHEFNSDNRRLYSGRDGTTILAEGKIEH